MCGIIGAIGLNDNPGKDILKYISHRGPDSEGFVNESDVFLGHTRLSIQDLSENGSQPMNSKDGNFVIIFNGEIYNHWELRKDLEKDFTFFSSSDTETVLNAYIKYGEDFLQMLNGIFALAIYDRSTKKLLIARDPIGVKPLYIYEQEGVLFFCSEIKGIQSFNLKNEISDKALANYLTYLWSPNGFTPYKNIRKLGPGSFISLSLNDPVTIIERKYYQIPFKGEYSSKNEDVLVDELEQKLLKAVDRQLLSDVPVGFFLSGGLDSSLLVAMAKKLHANKRFECFTIKTGSNFGAEGFSDDLSYAKKVARHLDVPLNVVDVDQNIADNFDKMIWFLDEPQADAAPLNVYNICKLARDKNIKVLIGGTGGDDLFSGYRRHQALRLNKHFEKVPLPLRKAVKSISSIMRSTTPGIRRFKKIASNFDEDSLGRMAGYFNWTSYDTMISLFNDQYRKSLSGYIPSDYLKDLNQEIPLENSALNQMLYWEMKSFLVDHNLNYTDKLSMAVGVEARVPFLDLELVEFSTKIPPDLKLKNNETKYLLKKVAERYLPLDVIYRPKTGFGAPVRKWITDDLKPLIEQRLNHKRLQEIGIFDSDKVWTLINDNEKGKIDASYTIWVILAIESWFRQFIEGKPYFK
ncbi:asparagine synthase (glutamine-hydrolyzing) [Gramella sp. KN1008]|uniref:asparagine synthase (glutamine-hydrolyzing) n=1 Tax=Gramella sp. KN1008 TaxID=2529298 RepID=UPI00103C5EB8|nr:asparagine synthase (glutamine-hydrolyzing) [Gramella sp. KN1008]TBW30125.1 asparagine synthase (glutamine-hydrolyzing) [Gramella sp. KN1008]